MLGGGDETSNGEECFVLEQPQDTAFVAKYRFPGAGFGSGSAAVVTLTDGMCCVLLKNTVISFHRIELKLFCLKLKTKM